MHDLSTEASPQETTPLQLGRQVSCSDGPAGQLSDVVIDPRERRVSHLVVEAPNGAARLVPAELLAPGWAAGNDVVVSCSVADISSLATIRSFSYVGLETFPEGDEQSDVGVEDLQVVPGFGVELGDFGSDLATGYAVTYDRIPPGSAELRRGSIVVLAEGAEIGTVDGFLVAGARLTHVVLQHTAVAIPIDSVTTIETDRITVTGPVDAFAPVEPRWLPLT